MNRNRIRVFDNWKSTAEELLQKMQNLRRNIQSGPAFPTNQKNEMIERYFLQYDMLRDSLYTMFPEEEVEEGQTILDNITNVAFSIPGMENNYANTRVSPRPYPGNGASSPPPYVPMSPPVYAYSPPMSPIHSNVDSVMSNYGSPRNINTRRRKNRKSRKHLRNSLHNSRKNRRNRRTARH